MNVFFFGDSICVGQYVSPHKTWVNLLSAGVEDRFADCFLVVNSSVNGSAARAALERMGPEVQAHGLCLLVTQFGLNDCNRWQTDNGLPRVSPEAFRNSLHEIVERVRTFGAKRIVLNTNRPTTKRSSDGRVDAAYQENNRFYNTIIRDVGNATDVVHLLDIEKSFDEEVAQRHPIEDLLLNDGVHLSTDGHQMYFKLVLNPLLGLLESVAEGAGLGKA